MINIEIGWCHDDTESGATPTELRCSINHWLSMLAIRLSRSVIRQGIDNTWLLIVRRETLRWSVIIFAARLDYLRRCCVKRYDRCKLQNAEIGWRKQPWELSLDLMRTYYKEMVKVPKFRLIAQVMNMPSLQFFYIFSSAVFRCFASTRCHFWKAWFEQGILKTGTWIQNCVEFRI